MCSLKCKQAKILQMYIKAFHRRLQPTNQTKESCITKLHVAWIDKGSTLNIWKSIKSYMNEGLTVKF